MATVIPFAQTHSFSLETAHAMVEAFDTAWEQLQDYPLFSAKATRDLLASRILEAAKRGVRDPDILRCEALG